MDFRMRSVSLFYHRYRLSISTFNGFLILIIGVLIGGWVFGTDRGWGNYLWDGGYLTNVFTEAWFFIGTVLVLDRLANRREQQQYKLRLIREASSRSNSIALYAIEQLQTMKWLTTWASIEQLLVDAPLYGANLENANLRYAALSRAKLDKAILRNADLRVADLSKASLIETDCERTEFSGANLQESRLYSTNFTQANLSDIKAHSAEWYKSNLTKANLYRADLKQASLRGTNFKDANLTECDLTKADLRYCNLFGSQIENSILHKAILPDGSLYTSQHNLLEFIDPVLYSKNYQETEWTQFYQQYLNSKYFSSNNWSEFLYNSGLPIYSDIPTEVLTYPSMNYTG